MTRPIAIIAVAISAATIALSVGCRRDGGETGAPPTAPVAPTGVQSAPTPESTRVVSSTAASRCSGLPDAPTDREGEITVGGSARTYILHLPLSYDGRVALPLVINLHGFGSNADDQARYSRFAALADSEGFIVVTPNGSGVPPRWNFVPVGGVDDVAFLGALIDDLGERLCVDLTRVYAAGMSNGAAMTTFVACGLRGRIAAIAAIGATAGPRLCPGDLPVPVITFRGTDDACVPYEGGTSSCGLMLPVVGAEEAIRLWGEHNGCAATPVVEQVSQHVRRTTYEECDGEADAVLYTVEGGGHTWPGSTFVPRLGPVTDEIDATALAWEFFKRYSSE